MKGNTSAKENIIKTTIAMIQEKKDVKDITIRAIVDRAGVGVGLINYHFNSKQNLIDICVQLIVNQVIGEFDSIYNSLEGTPVEKLKFMAKSTTNFMVTNPGISRISILHDLQEGNIEDNSMRSTRAYYQIFQDVFGGRKSEKEIKIMLQMFVAAIQVTFLHADVYQEYSGIDFFNKEDREDFIDNLVDLLAKCNL